jgi:hypothetical protein
MKWLTTAIFVCLLMPAAVAAQARIEKNVIYGMHSGLALLMDVHRPETPNGLGVLLVSGSGWQAPLRRRFEGRDRECRLDNESAALWLHGVRDQSSRRAAVPLSGRD